MFIFLFFILHTFHASASNKELLFDSLSSCFSQPSIVVPLRPVNSKREFNFTRPLILRKEGGRKESYRKDMRASVEASLSNQDNRENVRKKMKNIEHVFYGKAILSRVYEFDQESLSITSPDVKRIVMNLCRERIKSSSTPLEDLGTINPIDVQIRMNKLSEDSAFYIKKIAKEEHAKSIVSFIEEESRAVLIDYHQRIPEFGNLNFVTRDVSFEETHISLCFISRASKKDQFLKKISQDNDSTASSIGATTRNFFNDVCRVEQSVVCDDDLTRDVLASNVDQLSRRYESVRPTLSKRAKSFADQPLKSLKRSLESFEEI